MCAPPYFNRLIIKKIQERAIMNIYLIIFNDIKCDQKGDSDDL